MNRAGPLRPSLAAPGLEPVWELARRRLERAGTQSRGRLRLPRLGTSERLTLGALLGRPPGATVDLATLETALAALGVGEDLPAALAELGHAVSADPAQRRAERRMAASAREAARVAAAAWPERWAAEWMEEVIRAGGLRGLDVDGAVGLVAAVRAVLDRLERSGVDPVSRSDLAAAVLGSSHALDTGTRAEGAVTRALVHRLGPGRPRQLWEEAGAHLDLVSAPVLTWALPLLRPSPLASIAAEATAAGIPLHLTQLALRQHPVVVPTGADVLVVENPRLVEAAAERRATVAVVCTNGQPSGAVVLLIRQLLSSDAALRYHGDFDAAGLRICGRLVALGLVPWRMTADDYVAALRVAEAGGVDLPREASAIPSTPWDPELRAVMETHRRVVHEERLLDGLLVPAPAPAASNADAPNKPA